MSWFVSILFLPAFIGLLIRVGLATSLDQRFIALGAVMLCLEQSRMAAVDLHHVAQAKVQIQDCRLDRFHWVTLSTISIELIGFYAAVRWLGWGSLIVLASQVWFHLLAGIELQPDIDPPFQIRGIRQRLPVLAADVIALGLMGLWIAQSAALVAATLLFSITTTYGLVKYGLPLLRSPMRSDITDQSS
ncbi:MAG: hypothetical protein AAFX95_21050 [Cyanobacteria bacterium J06639_16]